MPSSGSTSQRSPDAPSPPPPSSARIASPGRARADPLHDQGLGGAVGVAHEVGAAALGREPARRAAERAPAAAPPPRGRRDSARASSSALTRGARRGRGARWRAPPGAGSARRPAAAAGDPPEARRPASPRPRGGVTRSSAPTTTSAGLREARGERADVGAERRCAAQSAIARRSAVRSRSAAPPAAGRPARVARQRPRVGHGREEGVAAALGAAADAGDAPGAASAAADERELERRRRRSRGGIRTARGSTQGAIRAMAGIAASGRWAARSIATWVPSECPTSADRRQLGDQRLERAGEGLRPGAGAREAGAGRRSPAGRPRPRGAPARGERGRQRAPALLEAVEAVDEEHRGPRPGLDRRDGAHGGTIRGRVGYPWPVSEKLELVAPRGYCAGVDRAIETVERVLEELGPPVYVRGEIVHNTHVVAIAGRQGRGVRGLSESRGARRARRSSCPPTASRPRCAGSAASASLRVIDATCPLVSKVHAEVRRYAAPRRDGAAGGPRATTTR